MMVDVFGGFVYWVEMVVAVIKLPSTKNEETTFQKLKGFYIFKINIYLKSH